MSSPPVFVDRAPRVPISTTHLPPHLLFLAGAKTDSCPKRGIHPHIHSHFYSVADARRSKRRLVPVFLFWKSKVGWDFPVSGAADRLCVRAGEGGEGRDQIEVG